MNMDIYKILNCVSNVFKGTNGPYFLHEPYFCGRERDYVADAIESGWVSSAGPYVERFENSLEKYCGVNHAVAVVNGTSALHICLILAGVERGDEVLVPTLTFIATANAISYCGAVPHFCDSEALTLGIDPDKLREHLSSIAICTDKGCFNKITGRRIAALMPMHVFGHPVRLDELSDICASWHIPMIEDAAEALGSLYKGTHVANHGLLAGISFNGNKIITSGGGGAILTNDPELAKLAKHLTTTAKITHEWKFEHDQIGFNYRMPNINAALGLAQLESMPLFLDAKRQLANRYIEAMEGIDGVRVFSDAEFSESNYWLVALVFDHESSEARDTFLRVSHEESIFTRPIWENMHTLKMYNNCPKMDLSVAESLQRRIVNLPSSASLGMSNRA